MNRFDSENRRALEFAAALVSAQLDKAPPPNPVKKNRELEILEEAGAIVAEQIGPNAPSQIAKDKEFAEALANACASSIYRGARKGDVSPAAPSAYVAPPQDAAAVHGPGGNRGSK